jgi:hypothetical protein
MDVDEANDGEDGDVLLLAAVSRPRRVNLHRLLVLRSAMGNMLVIPCSGAAEDCVDKKFVLPLAADVVT